MTSDKLTTVKATNVISLLNKADVKHSYVWTISKFDLDVKQEGEFTIVKKVPKGETQETTVTDEKNLFEGDCTIEKAQKFMDERYPNHLVLSVISL